MFCREQAARFSDWVDEFDSRGVTVIGVGSGNASMAADFVASHQPRFSVYCDPKRRLFDAFGMHRNLGLGLRSAGYALRALRSGHWQGRTAGDPWQQGGVALLDAAGRAVWTRAYHVAGEEIALPSLLAALDAHLDD